MFWAHHLQLSRTCKVQMFNRESISADSRLTKADFTTGDVVVIRFMNWDYSGVVDFPLDEETVSKRMESSTASSPPCPSSDAEQAKPPLPESLRIKCPSEPSGLQTWTSLPLPLLLIIRGRGASWYIHYRRRSYPTSGETPLPVCPGPDVRLVRVCTSAVVISF